MTSHSMDLDAFREELVRIGFSQGPTAGAYGRGPHEVRVEQGWTVLRETTTGGMHHPETALGAPGLWVVAALSRETA